MEFFVLILIVSVVSYTGVYIMENQFLPEENTGEFVRKNDAVGSLLDRRNLFDAVVYSVDPSMKVRKRKKVAAEPRLASAKMQISILRVVQEEIKNSKGAEDNLDLLDKVMARTAHQIGFRLPNKNAATTSSFRNIRMDSSR